MSQYFMEWLRATVVQGGNDAYAETQIATPVGRANNLAMAIHKTQWEHDEIDAPADQDSIQMHLAMDTQAAILNLNSSLLVDKYKNLVSLVTSGAFAIELPVNHEFYPPLLYAKSSMYLGIDTIGQGEVKTGYVRIGYTLRFVSPTRMVQALVE